MCVSQVLPPEGATAGRFFRLCVCLTLSSVFFYARVSGRAKKKKNDGQVLLTRQEFAANRRLLSESSRPERRQRADDGLKQLWCVHSSHTKGRPTPRFNKRKTSPTYCVFTQKIPLGSTFVHEENARLMFLSHFNPSILS